MLPNSISSAAKNFYINPSAQIPVVNVKTAAAPTQAGLAAGGTQVAISDEAIARLSKEQTGIPAWAHDMSSVLHRNPDNAAVASQVWQLASAVDDPLVTPGNPPGSPDTFTGTGTAVTAESLAAFRSQAQKVAAGRQSLYQTEVAKGTAPADIWDKLANFMEAQPLDYLGMAGGWGIHTTSTSSDR